MVVTLGRTIGGADSLVSNDPYSETDIPGYTHSIAHSVWIGLRDRINKITAQTAAKAAVLWTLDRITRTSSATIVPTLACHGTNECPFCAKSGCLGF